jgi:hypothetical protein
LLHLKFRSIIPLYEANVIESDCSFVTGTSECDRELPSKYGCGTGSIGQDESLGKYDTVTNSNSDTNSMSGIGKLQIAVTGT